MSIAWGELILTFIGNTVAPIALVSAVCWWAITQLTSVVKMYEDGRKEDKTQREKELTEQRELFGKVIASLTEIHGVVDKVSEEVTTITDSVDEIADKDTAIESTLQDITGRIKGVTDNVKDANQLIRDSNTTTTTRILDELKNTKESINSIQTTLVNYLIQRT